MKNDDIERLILEGHYYCDAVDNLIKGGYSRQYAISYAGLKRRTPEKIIESLVLALREVANWKVWGETVALPTLKELAIEVERFERQIYMPINRVP